MAHQLAFSDRLKNAMTTAPVLIQPDETKSYTIETDSSDFANGMALLQEGEDGKLHPVAFDGRKLHGAELRYATHEKELLAIKEALNRWRVYIDNGLPVTIITDHDSLNYMNTMKNPSKRLARWVEEFQSYNLNIKYRPGKLTTVPDALSRRPDYHLNAITLEKEEHIPHIQSFLVCDSLAANRDWHLLFALRLVNRKFSRISTDWLLASGKMKKLYRVPKHPRLPFERFELHSYERLPKMPMASVRHGVYSDQCCKVLTLVPLGVSSFRTAFGIEVTSLLPLHERSKFQYVQGRIGYAASSQKEEIFPWLNLVRANTVSLWVFDLLLHLQTESTPDNSLAQSFPGRQKISLDDYCQFLTAMERFSKITLPSSANPICPRPYHAFVTFPERPPNPDKVAPCIVAKEWRSEYVARLVSKLRGKLLDALLSKVATMMKEFLKTGWKIPYCEKFLYRNKDNGDIHI
jgi:hypothetical protein